MHRSSDRLSGITALTLQIYDARNVTLPAALFDAPVHEFGLTLASALH